MPGPLHESLRMYSVCKMMKWTHLPNAGGIYDQRPKLLDDFLTIAAVEGKEEARKEKDRQAKMARSSRRGRR